MYKMLVTCYYDIYNKPYLFMEYIYYFYDLATSGLPIIVFTEEKYISKFRIFGSNVSVVCLTLDELELFQIGKQYTRNLPSTRNVLKDTKEYLSLMNSKIEFISKASQICTDETFIWIDFDLMRYIKHPEPILKRLHILHTDTYDKIIIPGFTDNAALSMNEINSHFYGTFFIMPKRFIEDFFQHSKNVFGDFCKLPQYNISWEPNVWCVIEMCAMKSNITWYFADKNDTLITNLDSVLISKHSVTDSILKS